MKKKASQNRHAQRRAAERFGLTMGPKLHQKFIDAIQGGTASFVERQSHRVSVWDVEHEDQIVRLVYDRNRKQIVTLLYHTFLDQKPTKLKLVRDESAPEPRPNKPVKGYNWQKRLEQNPPSFVKEYETLGVAMPDAAREKRDRILADLDIDVATQRRYTDLIVSKRAKFINRQDKSVSMYEIEDNGETYWVMFNTHWCYITRVVKVNNQTLKLL